MIFYRRSPAAGPASSSFQNMTIEG